MVHLMHELQEQLRDVSILPRRMLLETPGVEATVPMLRGVWGAALHDLDGRAYAEVFGPNDEPPHGARMSASTPQPRLALNGRMREPSGGTHAREMPRPAAARGTIAAGYLLRPASPDPAFAPAIEWILIGDAIRHDFTLCRAWDVASGMGLGPGRNRFHIRQWLVLRPDESAAEQAAPWRLNEARWRVAAHPASHPQRTPCGRLPPEELSECEPCRLVFRAPLRLMRDGKLITSPTLADLVVAACRRVKSFLPAARHGDWENLGREALSVARMKRAEPWEGERLDLRRYSGRQHRELELRGVTGSLRLPDGPGELWPLLAAARWLHLGKGTVMGLGQFYVER